MHALGISTAAHRKKIAIINLVLSYRRDQFLAILQNIYECHFRVWQQMVF